MRLVMQLLRFEIYFENKRNSDTDQHSYTDTERNGRSSQEIEFDIDHCHPKWNAGCQQCD